MSLMFDIINWLSALISVAVSGLMLDGMAFGTRQREHLVQSIRTVVQAGVWRNVKKVDQVAFRSTLRLIMQVMALLLVFATSGVVVVLPLFGGLSASPFEVGMRFALTLFLALQAPCPLWRYLLKPHPHRRASPGEPHVH